MSAAYWDRDSLLWSFPTVVDADPALARRMLYYVFGRQRRNLGVHSRYIDGTVLEPGFELDELMAPVLALERYVGATGDRDCLEDNAIRSGLTDILRTLRTKRHRSIALYETFLQPTDDVRSYPYLTYDNVLVWKALRALSSLKHTATLPERRRSSAGRSWSTVLSRARTAHTMPGPRIWRAIQMYMTSRQEACCSCPTWASARRMTPHIRIQCVRSAPRSILTASPGAPLRKSAAPTPPIPGC